MSRFSRGFLFVLPGIAFLASLALAAVPQTISYQGYLKDGAGRPVPGPVTLGFAFYSSTRPASGALWSETQTGVLLANGAYSVTLGSDPAHQLTLPFDMPYYLGVTVNGTELPPRQLLTSVPYALIALRASTADAIGGQTLANLDNRYIEPSQPLRATPQQIASLQWDQVGGASGTHPVGMLPVAMAFDGTNIWVANNAGNTVQKINPATGAVLKQFPVGAGPSAVAFDGTSIWVANAGSNNVQKINPATGPMGSPIGVGSSPCALAFDGASIWVANYGNSVSSGTVQKIDIHTNTPSDPLGVGISPIALTFSGKTIWVANYGSNSVLGIDPNTRVINWIVEVGSKPSALAFDGTNVWVANSAGNSVQKINPLAGTAGAQIGVGSNPTALAFDGVNIWVANFGNNSVQQVNPFTGFVGAEIMVGLNPKALVFDGSSIWTANFGAATVSKLVAGGLPAGALTVGPAQVAPGSVTSAHLAAGAVDAHAMGANAVTTTALMDGQVTDTKLAPNSVTTAAIMDGNVTGPKLAAGAVDARVLGPNAVTSTAITDGQVTGPKLAPNAVTTVALMDGNVTGTKLAPGAVTTSAIADGSITSVKLAANMQIRYGNVAVVALSGGDYTDPVAALANRPSWCATPTAATPCLLMIMPGTYDLGTGTLAMQPYVDIEGSGENSTIIASAVRYGFTTLSGAVTGANNAELRNLTISNTTTIYDSVGIYNNNASPRLTRVSFKATGPNNNYALYNVNSSSPVMSFVTATAKEGQITRGVFNDSSSPLMDNVTATGTGGNFRNYGIHCVNSSSPTMTNVTANASGNGSIGIINEFSSPAMTNISVLAIAPPSGIGATTGITNSFSSPVMTNITAVASGDNARGIDNQDSNPTLTNVTATATGFTATGMVVAGSGASPIYIDRSTFRGTTSSITSAAYQNLKIGASKLVGPALCNGSCTCVASYDGTNYTALNTSCQ